MAEQPPEDPKPETGLSLTQRLPLARVGRVMDRLRGRRETLREELEDTESIIETVEFIFASMDSMLNRLDEGSAQGQTILRDLRAEVRKQRKAVTQILEQK